MSEKSKSKLKNYGGIFLIIFGLGLAFMSWFHNQIGWVLFGMGSISRYDILDQTCGAIGTLLTIFGITLVYLWSKSKWKKSEEDISIKNEESDEEVVETSMKNHESNPKNFQEHDRSNSSRKYLSMDEIEDEIQELKKDYPNFDDRDIEKAIEERNNAKANRIISKKKRLLENYQETLDDLKRLDKQKSSLAGKLADDEIDKSTYDDAIQNIETEKARLEEKLNKLRKEVIYEDYEKPF